MKVSVIISICDNRYDMFKRSLDTWCNQTMDKKEFELIVVDDADRKDILNLCKEYSEKGLQIKFIRIDNSKCDKPVTTFLPILSNNVGFRVATGKVVVITGPETLQSDKNLEVSYTLKGRKECAYGLVYKSDRLFMENIIVNWNKDKDFNYWLCSPGAKSDCRTCPPHPPAYWYYMAVSKKYIEAIGGVDEDFATGICAEDDDFSNRMRLSGVTPVFEHRIIGIHQDHSVEDLLDPRHNLREKEEGILLRKYNVELMRKNLSMKKIIANTDHIWGDEKVIVETVLLGY